MRRASLSPNRIPRGLALRILEIFYESNSNFSSSVKKFPIISRSAVGNYFATALLVTFKVVNDFLKQVSGPLDLRIFHVE